MNNNREDLSLNNIEPAFIDRSERLWLKISIVCLIFFCLGALFVTFFGFSTLPKLIKQNISFQGEVCTTPSALLETPMFANPTVIPRPDDGVDVYMIGRMWQWTPEHVVIPVGKKVRFFLTSADVIHGFRIIDTPVNIMVMPGMVASEEFVFKKPGKYKIACTEYCGVGHQNMVSIIEVVEKSL